MRERKVEDLTWVCFACAKQWNWGVLVCSCGSSEGMRPIDARDAAYLACRQAINRALRLGTSPSELLFELSDAVDQASFLNDAAMGEKIRNLARDFMFV